MSQELKHETESMDETDKHAESDATALYPIVEFARSTHPSTATMDSDNPRYLWGVIEYGTTASPDNRLPLGSVITLDETADDAVLLIIEGRVVAEGSLVREENRIGIKIAKLVDPTMPETSTTTMGEMRFVDDAA